MPHETFPGDSGVGTQEIEQTHAQALEMLRKRGLKGFVLLTSDDDGDICCTAGYPQAFPASLAVWHMALQRYSDILAAHIAELMLDRMFELLIEADDEDEDDNDL